MIEGSDSTMHLTHSAGAAQWWFSICSAACYGPFNTSCPACLILLWSFAQRFQSAHCKSCPVTKTQPLSQRCCQTACPRHWEPQHHRSACPLCLFLSRGGVPGIKLQTRWLFAATETAGVGTCVQCINQRFASREVARIMIFFTAYGVHCPCSR